MELAPDLEDQPENDGLCDWNEADTFIISGPLGGNEIKRPWERFFKGREDAYDWTTATYGRAVPVYHPRRWAFRVLRPTAPGGRYTPPNESRDGGLEDK